MLEDWYCRCVPLKEIKMKAYNVDYDVLEPIDSYGIGKRTSTVNSYSPDGAEAALCDLLDLPIGDLHKIKVESVRLVHNK